MGMITFLNHSRNSVRMTYTSIKQCRQQAWDSAAEERLGRRTGIRYTMSDTDRTELHLQLHNHWAARHTLLACSHFMATGYNPWTYHHSSQSQPNLPFQETLQGSSHYFW